MSSSIPFFSPLRRVRIAPCSSFMCPKSPMNLVPFPHAYVIFITISCASCLMISITLSWCSCVNAILFVHGIMYMLSCLCTGSCICWFYKMILFWFLKNKTNWNYIILIDLSPKKRCDLRMVCLNVFSIVLLVSLLIYIHKQERKSPGKYYGIRYKTRNNIFIFLC